MSLPPNTATTRRLPFLTWRELLTLVAVYFLLAVATAVFDEIRDLIQIVARIVLPCLVVFFFARGFWRWWKERSPAFSVAGVWTGLGIALVGWLNVALAIRVMHINEGNYALIVIVPLMWMIGLAISIASVFAIGLGAAVGTTGLRSGRPGILLGGLASVVLNVCHIATLIRVYTRH